MAISLGAALLVLAETDKTKQVPWSWTTWQELTELYHAPWLQPSELPKDVPPRYPSGWNDETVKAVRTFVDQFHLESDQHKKTAFYSARKQDVYGMGRKAFHKLISGISSQVRMTTIYRRFMRDNKVSVWDRMAAMDEPSVRRFSQIVLDNGGDLIRSTVSKP